MIITISGLPGSGKSTVANMLARRLRMKCYSMGNRRRKMARARGLTLEELNRLGERQAFTDVDADRWQRRLGQRADNFVIEGRTSFHFIPHSVKIFLAVDLGEAARRIFRNKQHLRRFEAVGGFRSERQLRQSLERRIDSDRKRYRQYYGLNIFRKSHYDLYFDTTNITAQAAVRKIVSFLAKVKQKNSAVNKLREKKGFARKRRK